VCNIDGERTIPSPFPSFCAFFSFLLSASCWTVALFLSPSRVFFFLHQTQRTVESPCSPIFFSNFSSSLPRLAKRAKGAFFFSRIFIFLRDALGVGAIKNEVTGTDFLLSPLFFFFFFPLGFLGVFPPSPSPFGLFFSLALGAVCVLRKRGEASSLPPSSSRFFFFFSFSLRLMRCARGH